MHLALIVGPRDDVDEIGNKAGNFATDEDVVASNDIFVLSFSRIDLAND